jgi:hypothetical protein
MELLYSDLPSRNDVRECWEKLDVAQSAATKIMDDLSIEYRTNNEFEMATKVTKEIEVIESAYMEADKMTHEYLYSRKDDASSIVTTGDGGERKRQLEMISQKMTNKHGTNKVGHEQHGMEKMEMGSMRCALMDNGVMDDGYVKHLKQNRQMEWDELKSDQLDAQVKRHAEILDVKKGYQTRPVVTG